MSPTFRRWAVLLAMVVAGCSVWRPQGLTPQAVIEQDHPALVRITRRDSTRVVFAHPAILGDSISGVSRGHRSTVPLNDVSYLSLRHTNYAGIIGLTGLGLAVSLVVLYAATAGS